MLFAARGVAGVGGGNMGVTQSYIADVTDEEHRDRAYAAFGVVFGVGIVLGPVTGGFLVHWGYWVPFCVAAVIEVVNIGLTWRFLPKTKSARRKDASGRLKIREAAKVAFEDPRVRSLIVRHFLFIFAVTYFFSIFALYVKHALDYGPEQASWLIATAGLVGGVALAVVVGPLAKRLGDARVAQIGFVLQVVAYAFLIFAHDLPAFVAVLVVWAIGASCIEPTIAALLSESAPADKRGATLGFNDSMSNVALMAAPSLGGWFIDRHLTLVAVTPGVAVFTAFVIGIMRRKEDATLATALGRRKKPATAA
jgi:MFS family permease